MKQKQNKPNKFNNKGVNGKQKDNHKASNNHQSKPHQAKPLAQKSDDKDEPQTTTFNGIALKTPLSKSIVSRIEEQGKEDSFWVYLSGMSKFSSRRDLMLLLGERKPTIIDPCLTPTHHFSGTYALKFGTPEEAREFSKHIRDTYQKQTGVPLHIHTPAWARSTALVLGSKANVNARTLRVDPGSQQSVQPDNLLTLLEDYGIMKNDIKRVMVLNRLSHFLVQFRTVQDAHRAATELDRKLLFRDIVKLSTFQC